MYVAGLNDDPVMIVPEESQYGGDTIITCDWGFNRNAKVVTFYRRPEKLPKEQVAEFELKPNGQLIRAKLHSTKFDKGLRTKMKVSLIIHDVLKNDTGPYLCKVTVKGTGISEADQTRESGEKRLNIKRRCNQHVGKIQ